MVVTNYRMRDSRKSVVLLPCDIPQLVGRRSCECAQENSRGDAKGLF